MPRAPAPITLLALAACLASHAEASPREGATWNNAPSIAASGSSENTHLTLAAAESYTVTRIRVSATLASVIPSTYALEARLRVTPPAGPAFTLQPFLDGSFTELSTPGDVVFSLATAVPSLGGWDVELFESFNDGDGPDATWTTLTITLDDEAPPSPPANDACGSAITTAVGGVYPGSTQDATNDGTASCGESAGSKDVWYAFTAPEAGNYRFSTCDTFGFDTVMSLLESCGGPEIECVDDTAHGCSQSGLLAEIRRPLAAGQSLLIRIAGYSGASGPYTLHVEELPPDPSANDVCNAPAALPEGDAQPFDTRGATDSGTPALCAPDGTLHHDVFFSVTASCTGQMTISTCGTGFDTALAVFDACGGTSLACADGGCDGGPAASVSFACVEGSTYLIALGGAAPGARGVGVLSVHCGVAPPACPPDFNGDGFLDFFDYDDYVLCFETGVCPPGRTADFNGDDFADFFDYDDFVLNFELGC